MNRLGNIETDQPTEFSAQFIENLLKKRRIPAKAFHAFLTSQNKRTVPRLEPSGEILFRTTPSQPSFYKFISHCGNRDVELFLLLSAGMSDTLEDDDSPSLQAHGTKIMLERPRSHSALGGTSHVCRFSCIFSCLVQSFFRVKAFPHFGQENGFSPLWLRS